MTDKFIHSNVWLWRIMISFDQMLNVIFSPVLNIIFDVAPEHKFGGVDETLSSVFGKNLDRCAKCRFICKWLGWIDKRHCRKSIEVDG